MFDDEDVSIGEPIKRESVVVSDEDRDEAARENYEEWLHFEGSLDDIRCYYGSEENVHPLVWDYMVKRNRQTG